MLRKARSKTSPIVAEVFMARALSPKKIARGGVGDRFLIWEFYLWNPNQ